VTSVEDCFSRLPVSRSRDMRKTASGSVGTGVAGVRAAPLGLGVLETTAEAALVEAAPGFAPAADEPGAVVPPAVCPLLEFAEPADVADAGVEVRGFCVGFGVRLETLFIAPTAGGSAFPQLFRLKQSAALRKRTTGRLGRLIMFFGKYGICQRFRHEQSENTIVRRSRGRRTFPTDQVLKGMNQAAAEITAAPRPTDMRDERGF
jgi:hypothetical protein